jgi:hypothetical protein
VHVAWVVNDAVVERATDHVFSYLASYRYRVFIPAVELARAGWQATVIAVTPDPGSIERFKLSLRGVDVVVFSKLFTATAIQPLLMQAAREAGVRTMVDVSDDFVDKAYAAPYRDAVKAADAVSTSSAFLTARIAEMTGKQATVILDPYEGERGEPRWAPRPRLEALWFGNVTNLSGLELSLPQLLESGDRMHLVVVTRLARAVREWGQLRNGTLAPDIDLELREWSPEATAGALRDCDVVLLPINRDVRYYSSKGPNRMVESLWAGRFVVAQPLPAYDEFREWAWIGENLADGLAWARAHPAEVVERIAAAQAHIARRYAPPVVAGTWSALLQRLADKGVRNL